jgi:hypothetical protein
MRIGLPVRIMGAAVLLALGLVGLVAREGMARAQGQEALLAIEAYDPRSLLSGHYLQFQFREALAADAACPPGTEAPPFRPGWVALAPAGGRHRVAGMAEGREAARRLGPLVVRGLASCTDTGTPMGGRAKAVQLNLGLNRFHAEQRQAEAMGKALLQAPAGESLAVVSVGGDGKARLKGVVVGGTRTDLDWF